MASIVARMLGERMAAVRPPQAPGSAKTMAAADTLDRAREAFERQAWTEAHARLSAADRDAPLPPEDLERLAVAAHLLGKDSECWDVWTRAHQGFLESGSVERAVRCAFWLADTLLSRGEQARGGGWVARARRLLDDSRLECVEQGYLLLPAGFQCIVAGDCARAAATFGEAARLGGRFANPDLVALARHGQGRALIRMGRTDEGVALLDEAMVAVEARELSPIVVGQVYCSVLAGCLEIFDLRRAREWTAGMSRWCESQPDLMAYTGECLVRRAEILQLHGAWTDALDAAARAHARGSQARDQVPIGAACYQQAELHRLRGEFEEAEEGYRQASRCGRKPQPGLAWLRLAQGQVDAAATAIRLALDEATERRGRARLLPAHVEIMLAARDIPAARASSDELSRMAVDLDAPLLRALAGQARGAVLLAEGDSQAALADLRRAWSAWQEIEAPYETARVRVLVGLAYRERGDDDAAEMELDAARWVFRELGARPDVARVDALSPRAVGAGVLSGRELQVLRLLAAGRSNRAIAEQLFISERTVERHVSNIFVKADVSSRAAATAYAYQNRLV